MVVHTATSELWAWGRIAARARSKSEIFSTPLKRWVMASGRLTGPTFTALRWFARLDQVRGASSAVLRIKAIDHAPVETQRQILPADKSISAAPVDALSGADDALPQIDLEVQPSVRWLQFSDVCLRGTLRTGWTDEAGLYINSNDFALGLHQSTTGRQGSLSKDVAVKFHEVTRKVGSKDVLVHTPRHVATIPRALYVGGFASDNWYHWLTNRLPRLWLATKACGTIESLPALVPERALSVPNIARSIDALWSPREVIALPTWECLRVTEMHWISDFSTDPDHMDPQERPASVSYHRAAMLGYRAALVASLRDEIGRVAEGPRRVFLDRAGASRAYNRNEVLAVAQRFGFSAVDSSQLSLAEQVALFERAEAVIGPSGAAWANLLFAKPTTRVIYWIPQHLAGTQIWSSLGALAGCRVKELTYPTGPGTSFLANEYVLPAETLETALARLW